MQISLASLLLIKLIVTGSIRKKEKVLSAGFFDIGLRIFPQLASHPFSSFISHNIQVDKLSVKLLSQ